MSRHPYQRNHKPKQATPVAQVDHVQPRAALRSDPGFIYPDEPPCRIERPEPCDIPFDCAQGKPASYRRTR